MIHAPVKAGESINTAAGKSEGVKTLAPYTHRIVVADGGGIGRQFQPGRAVAKREVDAQIRAAEALAVGAADRPFLIQPVLYSLTT